MPVVIVVGVALAHPAMPRGRVGQDQQGVISIPYDTTPFVEESVHEVYKTLAEAGVLVLVVILLFLQDWRAVLIPATTVPVTIIGAFAGMAALGFSINLLTLFGLVLAIGIVVDDAIVIVENAVHHIDRNRIPPRQATTQAMSEVIGPVIGITLVLMAVFLPTAFLGGITGQLYRQFALTIAVTALISAVNAVTLKLAQCAVYLRPTRERKNRIVSGLKKKRPARRFASRISSMVLNMESPLRCSRPRDVGASSGRWTSHPEHKSRRDNTQRLFTRSRGYLL